MQLVRLLNSFDRKLISSKLAVARPGGSYEKFLDDDVDIKHLTTCRLKSSTLTTVSSIPGLIRCIREFRPDAVLSVLDPAIAATSVALSMLKRHERPKFIACSQNNFTMESLDRKFSAKWTQRFITRGYLDSDLIIALSQGVADDLGCVIAGTRQKIKVIPNAAYDATIVSQAEMPCQTPRPTDGPLLVSCGRFVPQKDFPCLIHAISELNRSRRVYLWMLGTGSGLEPMKRLVSDLGLEGIVSFLGFQDNPYPYFKQADLFVLPSLWEGFGNVIVEAMACGTPVLSTSCPFGPSEIITDEVNGLLVEPGNPRALAHRIQYALDHPEILRKMSLLGLDRAKDFTTSLIAKQYASAIFDLTT